MKTIFTNNLQGEKVYIVLNEVDEVYNIKIDEEIRRIK